MHFHINFKDNWSFCLDPENIGEETRLFSKLPKKAQKIELPHIWQTSDPQKDCSIGYYYKKFKLPQDQPYKKFILHFESVYHFLKLWINEKLVGEHLGGNVPFEFDISSYVSLTNENLISIKVERPNHENILEKLSLKEIPVGSLNNSHLFFGINGNVQLAASSIPAVKKVECYPDYEGNIITIDTQFWAPKNQKLEVLYNITDPSGKTDSLPKILESSKENPKHLISFNITNAEEWNLENPKLYGLEIKLTNGSSVKTTFGLRRVEIEKSMIRLNHKNQPFKGVQFKQKFPFTFTIPHFKQDLKKELTLLKQSGFNLIRSGSLPLNHKVLDLCDSLGIMVIQETTCFTQKSSKKGFYWIKQHIESIIKEYGNHPSIVVWGMGSDNASMALENGNKLIKFTSQIDPFRPIISNFNSVFLDSNNAEEIDKGKIYSPTDMEIYQFESHRFYLAFPLRTKTENFLRYYCSYKDSKEVKDGVHGRKSFWEKYNYIKSNLDGKILIGGLGVGIPNKTSSLLEKKHFKLFKNTNLYKNLKNYENSISTFIKKTGLWKKPEDFFEQCKNLLEENTLAELSIIASNTQISGYMFESWTDEDHLYKGLTDWDRNPKSLLNTVADFNNNPKILPQIVSRTPYFGSHFSLDLALLVSEYEKYVPTVDILNKKNKIVNSKKLPPQKGYKTVEVIKGITLPLKKELGLLTCRITLTSKQETFKRDFPFLVPPAIDIDRVLSKIDYQGISTPFIQIQNNPKSKTIIINQIENLNKSELVPLFGRAKQGATLILSPLKIKSVNILNDLKVLPCQIKLNYCAWAEGGSYHIANDRSFFKNFQKPILGSLYADILPQWSFDSLPQTKTYASCLNLLKDKIQENQTLATLPFGKGKIVFCQFDIFDELGQNALIDYFFSHLIQKI